MKFANDGRPREFGERPFNDAAIRRRKMWLQVLFAVGAPAAVVAAIELNSSVPFIVLIAYLLVVQRLIVRNEQ